MIVLSTGPKHSYTVLTVLYCEFLHSQNVLRTSDIFFLHRPFGLNMLLTSRMGKHTLNIRHIVQGDTYT